jgi:uncharacterized membrane protein YphA (DoxX/SURF4 family)
MFNEPGLSHALLLVLVVGALYALRKRLPGTQLGRSRDQFESPQARRRRRQLIALECTELALAGVFFLVGGAKLIGRHDMVELFRSIGVGQWLRYVTGAFEVVGAAFMVVPLASGASAVALGTVILGHAHRAVRAATAAHRGHGMPQRSHLRRLEPPAAPGWK